MPITDPVAESSVESRSTQFDPLERNAFRKNPSLVSRNPAEDVPSLVGLGESASLRGASFTAEAGPVAGLPENGTRFPAIVDQLQPALHQAVTQDRRLTIMLRPPELGPVQIDVLRHDGRMSARLQTETASAHQLLTEHLPQLREVLTQMGVAADQVQVVRSETPLPESTGGDARADGKTDAQNAGQRQESRQQAPPEPQLADEPEREDPNWPNIRTRTALNLRI
jgi:flagellar hook-length control protein FliK